MRWLPAFVLLQVFAALACASASDSGSQTSPTAAGLDQPFAVKAGASVRLQSENLQVGFDRVVSDSRCPRGAQCIAAGEAVVSVWAVKAAAPREAHDLSTSPEGSEVAFGGYRIRLVTLDPYPTVDGTIRPSDYVATLVVTRNQ